MKGTKLEVITEGTGNISIHGIYRKFSKSGRLEELPEMRCHRRGFGIISSAPMSLDCRPYRLPYGEIQEKGLVRGICRVFLTNTFDVFGVLIQDYCLDPKPMFQRGTEDEKWKKFIRYLKIKVPAEKNIKQLREILAETDDWSQEDFVREFRNKWDYFFENNSSLTFRYTIEEFVDIPFLGVLTQSSLRLGDHDYHRAYIRPFSKMWRDYALTDKHSIIKFGGLSDEGIKQYNKLARLVEASNIYET